MQRVRRPTFELQHGCRHVNIKHGATQFQAAPLAETNCSLTLEVEDVDVAVQGAAVGSLISEIHLETAYYTTKVGQAKHDNSSGGRYEGHVGFVSIRNSLQGKLVQMF
jgi:hypothetical protein